MAVSPRLLACLLACLLAEVCIHGDGFQWCAVHLREGGGREGGREGGRGVDGVLGREGGMGREGRMECGRGGREGGRREGINGLVVCIRAEVRGGNSI